VNDRLIRPAGVTDAPPLAPELPEGRSVELPDRGTTFIREIEGPPGAPTVVLLHGWTVTADINFFTAYELLGRHFRVITIDHRGHGGGIRTRAVFRLEDCADDVAVLIDTLRLGPVIVVGYSMGGAVAQLVCHRHPTLVAGVVLCSTARMFNGGKGEAISFFGLAGLAALSRLAPEQARVWMTDQFISRKGRSYQAWALQQVRGNDVVKMLEAGHAIGQFSSREWIGYVPVPAAVIVTMQDRTVPARRQLRLADSLPNAVVYRVAAGHDACIGASDVWVPMLLAAIQDVADRAASTRI
jgi:3-oxoadipate enol-lactonase